MSAQDPSPRKSRRRLAISVRVVMLLTLVFAAGLSYKVRRAQAQRRAVAQIKQAGGDVYYDYAYSLAESPWAPTWLRGLETTSVSYYLPAGVPAGKQRAQSGESVAIRSFQFSGANPNTLPPIKMSVSVQASSSKGVQSPVLPPFEDIDTLTINQIESARLTASFFDEEMAPVTTAILLDSATTKKDDAVEIAKLKTDLLTGPHAGRQPGSQHDDARGRWKLLERRDSYSSAWQPAWLQRLIGDQYFQAVTSVSFHGNTTDDQLGYVEGLDQIVDLKLGEAKNITDAGLAHLAGLTRLRNLDLRDAVGLTDGALAYLGKMTELRELCWGASTISEAGITQLARLPHLQKLSLGRVTDGGLAHLAELTELQELELIGANISDAGLASLKKLKKLQRLNLACNRRITNDGLEHLAGLTELSDLNLSYCPNITDTGSRHLRSLSKLRRLNLDETWVSDAEVAAATAATPGLVISRRGRPLF
jgi:Leucine-rich repeat (LRR) protein